MPIHPKFGAAVKALAAKNADPAVIKDILDSEDGLAKFGVNTPLKAAHFLAQTSHESGGFRIAIENMNYSAKRLMQVFPKRFPTLAKAQQFAGNPQKIRAFLEKPTDPVGLPDSPDEVLASMGNYVFTADALRDAVTRDAELEQSKHDMGGDIVPWFVDKSESAVYDYKDNEVPGSTDRDRGYWRDVGTMRSYYDAHLDLVSPLPVFNLYNKAWPIYTSYGPHPPAKLVEGASGAGVSTFNSILSPGVVVSGGTVNQSVLSPAVWVKDGAEVSDSVLMDGVHIGEGAIVRNAIIDKGVVVPPGVQIGVDQEADRARGFVVDEGLTVLAKQQPVPGE